MMWDVLWAALLAAAMTAALSPMVMAAAIWDVPDLQRKAHARPVPTCGGIAILFGTFGALLVLLSPWGFGLVGTLSAKDVGLLAGALAAAVAGFGIGLVDDLRPLGPKTKFGLIALIGLLVSIFVARAGRLELGAGFGLELPMVLAVLGSALWLFTLVNATNFIDGANGMAMGTMGIGLIGLGVISSVHGAPVAALLSFLAAGAAGGFLVWNFPRGAIFAGDCGSLFVGTLAAVAGLIAVQEAGISALIPPLLFFPVLADVLLTLLWRTKHRTDLFNGHRDHLYQIGMRAKLAHWQVSLIYWAVSAHCAAVALLASFGGQVAAPTAIADAAGAGALGWVYAGFGAVASFMPVIALAVVAAVSVKVSGAVRRFAATRGLDAP